MLIVSTVAAAVAALALAQGVSGPAAGSVQSAPPKATSIGKPTDMICKRIVATGSMIPDKDCRTRAQWDQQTADSKDFTHYVNTNSNYNPH